MTLMHDRFQAASEFSRDHLVPFGANQPQLLLAPRSGHKKRVLDPKCFPRRPNCVEGTAQSFGRFLV
jgi:hypothetical protein